MNFQDELNELKKDPPMPNNNNLNENDINHAINEIINIVVKILKHKASYCTKGTKLNCDFHLYCSCFWNQELTIIHEETFFRDRMIKIICSVKSDIDIFYKSLERALRPYNVTISDFAFFRGYAITKIDEADTNTYEISTPIGSLFLRQNNNMPKRTIFDILTPYTIIKTSRTEKHGFHSGESRINFRAVEQNNKRFNNIDVFPMFLLSYREN